MAEPSGHSMRAGEVTRILVQADRGDAHAPDTLLPAVYAELRELARRRMAAERPGQTIQATALVHEAYMRLVGDAPAHAAAWDNRGHFFAAAAEAMRRILVERARRKGRRRHGGGRGRVDLDAVAVVADEPARAVHGGHGEFLARQRRFDEAERHVSRSRAVLTQTFGEDHARTHLAAERLAALSEARGDRP